MLGGYPPLSTFINQKSLLARSLVSLGSQLTSCRLCHQTADHTGVLCSACRQTLPINTHACTMCALPLVVDKPTNSYCPDCLQQAKPYSQSLCPLLYCHPTKQLIHDYKQSGQWAVEQLLTSLWRPYAQRLGRFDVIIPVPARRKHVRHRGFSHSHNLARQLSTLLKQPLIDALDYTSEPLEQKSLKRQQRLANLKGVFTATHDLTDKRVILVDDVITTCATVMAASQQLTAAGASDVCIVAIARTP